MLRRKLRVTTRKFLQFFVRNLRFNLCVLFCFLVGLLILLTARQSNFDTRFFLRGAQPVPDNIILLTLSREDLSWISTSQNRSHMWSLQEIVQVSDGLFWNPVVWRDAFRILDQHHVKAIITTLFFDQEVIKDTLSSHDFDTLTDGPYFWAAHTDSHGQIKLPYFADRNASNTGTVLLRPNHDGKVRHLLLTTTTVPYLGLNVMEFFEGHEAHASQRQGQLINFKGPSGTYKEIKFADLIEGKVPDKTLNNAIVIIGLKDFLSDIVQTPVGPLSESEVLATVLDNFLYDQWITLSPLWLDVLYLLIVLAVSLWIIQAFPQGVSFVFLLFFSLGICALSAGLFDLQQVWLPLEAPLGIVIVVYVVMSSFKLAESERHTWQTEKENRYIGEVEELKNNFLSLISHDLKNPLAKIQGITDRLLTANTGKVSKETSEDLSRIKNLSEELRRYITSILQLTRIEARNIKLSKEVCDINAVIREVVDRLEPLALEKQISFNVDLEPLFSMEADRTLIAEVLINLVENAIKYSPSHSTITIVSHEVGNTVRVEITDRGPGIDAKEAPKIFDKFYRGSKDKKSTAAGTGLGLYLVKYFIELHGGSVFLETNIGMGTQIGFTLPLEEPKSNYAEFTRSHS